MLSEYCQFVRRFSGVTLKDRAGYMIVPCAGRTSTQCFSKACANFPTVSTTETLG